MFLLTGSVMFMLSSKSAGLYHLYYMAITPEDLYQPLIISKFHFHKKDFIAEYKINPKYRNIHEVGFKIKPNILPSGWGKNKGKYTFSGKLKLQFYQAGNLVDEAIITKHLTFGYQKDNMDFIKSVSLYTFPMPQKGFFLKEVTLKIKVVKPDAMLEKYAEFIDLTIRVSPTP